MKILFTEKEIQDRITQAAFLLNNDFEEKPDVILCVLSGSILFFSDLIKQLTFDFEIDFIKTSSYSANGVQQQISIKGPFSIDLEGKRVLIIEDIIDSGRTLQQLLVYLRDFKCKEVEIVSLLKRKATQAHFTYEDRRVKVGYCFEVEDDAWLIGYGLDDDQKKRNLKDIYVKE